MSSERSGEIFPGYAPVIAFGHPLTIDGRQVYYNASRGEHAIEAEFRYLTGLSEKERIIVEHISSWAKEGEL